MTKTKVKKDEEHGLPSLSLVAGYIAVKELGRLEDSVGILARLGYGNAEIAKICDTTVASVKMAKVKQGLELLKEKTMGWKPVPDAIHVETTDLGVKAK